MLYIPHDIIRDHSEPARTVLYQENQKNQEIREWSCKDTPSHVTLSKGLTDLKLYIRPYIKLFLGLTLSPLPIKLSPKISFNDLFII